MIRNMFVSPYLYRIVSNNQVVLLNINAMGSDCGAVGRAVASNTRGPWFESSHRQLLLNIHLLLTVCRKDKNKEKKEAANGPLLITSMQATSW